MTTVRYSNNRIETFTGRTFTRTDLSVIGFGTTGFDANGFGAPGLGATGFGATGFDLNGFNQFQNGFGSTGFGTTGLNGIDTGVNGFGEVEPIVEPVDPVDENAKLSRPQSLFSAPNNNPYAPYPYQYFVNPQFFAPNTAPYRITGAPISAYYNPYNPTVAQPSKPKKASKKKSTSKKPPKDSERLLTVSRITITPSTPSQPTVQQSQKESISNLIYSPDFQAAYLNYLNIYKPNENYRNRPNLNGVSQYVQPNSPNYQNVPNLNGADPYNRPFSGQSSFTTPNNGQNSFVGPSSPFSGYNPALSFSGNAPPQLPANQAILINNSQADNASEQQNETNEDASM